MTRTALPIVIVAIIGVWTSTFAAAAGADKAVAYMGKGLAETLCASCHTVSGDQATPGRNPASPKFKDIANKPGVTSDSLREFLLSTRHQQFAPLSMPNPALTDDELTKIIAYILSLRDQH